MLIVKKFGGTSVADKERIERVAGRCIEDYKKGNVEISLNIADCPNFQVFSTENRVVVMKMNHFKSVFIIPEERRYDFNKISTKRKDGLLIITIPKRTRQWKD